MNLNNNPFYTQGQQPQRGNQGGGQMAGNIANAGLAGINFYSDVRSNLNQIDSYNTNVAGQNMNSYGQPDYNLGEDVARLGAMNPNDAGKGMVGKGVAAGASAGAAFGPYGAAIGAVAGAIGGFIGRGAARRKAREKQRELKNNVLGAQSAFNESNQRYSQNSAAQAEYYDQMQDRQQQMTAGLYGIPQRYY